MDTNNIDNKVVAFLDLLGFSQLLELNTESALCNLISFNDAIKTRVFDNKAHPLDEYKKEDTSNDKSLYSFAKKHSVTSFENLISFSDSLIIGSHDLDLFVEQLSCLIAELYITTTEPFRKSFNSIDDVYSNKNATYENGKLKYCKAFPILFRGGLSLGNEVVFFKENSIIEGTFGREGYSVFGKTYLNAVNLESAGKGPRLFCDKSVADNLTNKELLRVVDTQKGIYEILWTILACETHECVSDCFDNVYRCISKTMLPTAINLVCFYKSDNKYKKILPHYEELLKLVCRGIVIYSDLKCNKATKALELINVKLKSKGLHPYTLNNLL